MSHVILPEGRRCWHMGILADKDAGSQIASERLVIEFCFRDEWIDSN